MKKKVADIPEEVVSMVKMGGYYKWDWKFPFRHFVKEKTIIGTKKAIYEFTYEKENN